MENLSFSYLKKNKGNLKFNSQGYVIKGELISWKNIEIPDKKKELSLIISLTDGQDIIHFLLPYTSVPKSIKQYFDFFAFPGTYLKVICTLRAVTTPSISNDPVFKMGDFLSTKKNMNIFIRGCPSYNEWQNQKNNTKLTKISKMKNMPKLTTASDLYDQDITHSSKFNYKTVSQEHSTEKETVFSSLRNFNNLLQLEQDGENSNNKDVPILDVKKYQWFFNLHGKNLLNIPLTDPFFLTKIAYDRPRLSFIYRYEPSGKGAVAIYWYNAELKWIRIILIKCKSYNDYIILKILTEDIESLEDLQNKLKFKKIKRKNKLTENDWLNLD